MYYIFFFSSRRRHTRYIGDWSSDVCSSDLSEYIDMNSIMTIPLTLTLPDSTMKIKEVDVIVKEHQKFRNVEREIVHFDKSERSEERRVGKECRSWKMMESRNINYKWRYK